MRFVTIMFLVALVGGGCRPNQPTPVTIPTSPHLAWVFEATRPGTILASPAVSADAIYFAASHSRGIDVRGAVYAIDPATGKTIWVFDRDGKMLPTGSTPLVESSRVYFGEGMHGNSDCRIHCLDAATRRLVWDRSVGDHIEGGPVAADGLVLFPAGNDGVYAVDAGTGKVKWNFRGDLHIDSTPAIAGGRAFVGSGTSGRFQNFQVVCLDVATGNPVWQTPVSLPAWGNPLVVVDRVYVGLGNGRLNDAARQRESPAGAMTCLDAKSGQLFWTFPVGRAVFGKPAVVGDRIIFGSRDGNLHCVDPFGREAYRFPMGGPVAAGVPAASGRVYAVSVAGRIVCLDPSTGTELWRCELARPGIEPQVFATPVIAGNRLYVAAEMNTGANGIVSLFCFDLPEGEEGSP
jgi:outer membrane protein assembly factor BamB